MDPTTGTIDMDLIQTGISAGDRTLRAQLTQEVRALIQRTSLTASLSAYGALALTLCRHLVGSVHHSCTCLCSLVVRVSGGLPVAC